MAGEIDLFYKGLLLENFQPRIPIGYSNTSRETLTESVPDS